MENLVTPEVLLGIIAISAALLAWFLIDSGSRALDRYRTRFTERTEFEIRDLFFTIDPRKLFVANIAIMMLGAVLVWLLSGSALFAIPAFFLLAFLPRAMFFTMRKRRLRNFEEQLPDALLSLSGGLRAGIGLNSALVQVLAQSQDPLRQEFAIVLREQRLGVTAEQSLDNLGRRVPTESTVLVVTAMRIALETGGGLAETLERTAQTLRARLQMEGKIRALTAQGRLQAWIVGGLPFVLMLVLNRIEPAAMGQLWNTQLGWAVLGVIICLELLGVFLIRKIVAINI